MGLQDSMNNFISSVGHDQVREKVIDFILGELDGGATLEEIMETPYIKSRLNESEKAALLSNPEIAEAELAEVRDTFARLRNKI